MARISQDKEMHPKIEMLFVASESFEVNPNPLILISADTTLNLPMMIFPGKEEETLDILHTARSPGQGTLHMARTQVLDTPARTLGTPIMTWGIQNMDMITGSQTRDMQRTMDTQVIHTATVLALGLGQQTTDLQQGVLQQPSQDTIVNSMRY